MYHRRANVRIGVSDAMFFLEGKFGKQNVLISFEDYA